MIPSQKNCLNEQLVAPREMERQTLMNQEIFLPFCNACGKVFIFIGERDVELYGVFCKGIGIFSKGRTFDVSAFAVLNRDIYDCD